MTSEVGREPTRAYVWVWLPGALTPVAAGLLTLDAQAGHAFLYGRSYL